VSEQRERIREHLAEHPGEHFSGLERALDLAPGQVQYHLKRLTRADRVVADHRYGRTHYYPPEYDEWERAALALVRRETTRDVLFYLLEHGPSAPATVADDLEIARSTLEWHLDRLVAEDVVEKARDDRNRVTLVLSRPTETARLLRKVEPALPERLVDRFARLVDTLLAE